MLLKGRVWVYGDDVDTDVIIPAKYLNTSDPKELAAHVMEGAGTEMAENVNPGDIIVAGKNFGCGSSREHAPIAIKAAGVSAVVAGSFARIFYRNAFNIGLPIFEASGIIEGMENGDEMEIDAGSGVIRNVTKDMEFTAKPIPEFMRELIEKGGLVEWTREKIKA
jgi:3-isopropylmalate/(R)-2-methylmalate dehydratase small subunit